MDTNVHEITVFITGSIDIRSLDNKYVTKTITEKYTIETEATDLLLNQCLEQDLPNQLKSRPLQLTDPV